METEMTKMTNQEVDNEPIYFAPKRVTMASDFASVLSWIVLVGFIGYIILGIISLRAQVVTNNYALKDLLKEPSFFVYLFTNMVIPLLTGLAFFAVLQAASAGLNMLLEKDFNAREAKANR